MCCDTCLVATQWQECGSFGGHCWFQYMLGPPVSHQCPTVSNRQLRTLWTPNCNQLIFVRPGQHFLGIPTHSAKQKGQLLLGAVLDRTTTCILKTLPKEQRTQRISVSTKITVFLPPIMTNLQLQNLDQTKVSKVGPTFSFKILTKLKFPNLDQASAS